jgi:ribosome-binding factor A
VRHSKKPWKGRARGAAADLAFEQALRGSRGREQSGRFDPRADRKTLQLCRQVHRALMLALSGECSDDLLRDLVVDAVEPMGSASQLIVRVGVPRGAAGQSFAEILARLNERTPKLRATVAQAICRKRVPMLSFALVPAIDAGGIGGKEAADERE